MKNEILIIKKYGINNNEDCLYLLKVKTLKINYIL